jgi:hypothetical protein
MMVGNDCCLSRKTLGYNWQADLSYCYGCDWIVQEYHGKWETHNSQPYDTQQGCLVAKREQNDRDADRLRRCIHESDLP